MIMATAAKAADKPADDDAPKPRQASGKVLNANVYFTHPDTGESHLAHAGDAPPSWAGDQVGDHLLTDEAETAVEPHVLVPLRREDVPARGASRPTWAAYAAAHGVVVGSGADKEAILDALDNAGVPTS